MEGSPVALLNGVMLGSVLGLIVLAWFHSPGLSAVIAIALTCNLLFAALAGVLVPLTLKRFGFDPRWPVASSSLR